MDPENKAKIDALVREESQLLDDVLTAYRVVDKRVPRLREITAEKIRLGEDPSRCYDYPELFSYPEHLQELARWLLEAADLIKGPPIQ